MADTPKYLDPKKYIHEVPNQNNDEIGQILSGRHEQQRREEMIDRMISDFNVYADKDNYISEQEFQKFIPLFSHELGEKVANRTVTREELDLITTLSEEFYRNYNIQKPTHVVDRAGNDVMPPIPPFLRRLSCMSDNLLQVIDEFHTAHAMDDGNSGGVIDLKKKKAIVELFRGLKMSQFFAEETRDALQFKKQADALNKVIFHDQLEQVSQQVTPQKQTVNVTPAPNTVDEYEMEYGPVDE